MKQTIRQFVCPSVATLLLAIVLAGFNRNKLTPEEAHAIAQEAYLFGLPPVYNSLQAEVLSNAPKPEAMHAPFGQFFHYRRFPEASLKEIAGFNVDALYSTGLIDVWREPYVLSIPPMGDRYWIVQLIDAWSEIPAAPSARTVGGEGGNFVIAGPKWSDPLPEGMTVIRPSTSLVMVAPRIYTSGKDDEANVHRLQDQFKLTPLSKWGTDYAPPAALPVRLGVDARTPVSRQVFGMTPDVYFSRLAGLLLHNPPHVADRDVLTRMEKIGITPGAPFRIDSFGPGVRKAIKEGVIAAQKEIEESRSRLGEIRNGWQVTQDLGRYGTRYAQRAAWTYYALGANLVGDAFYATATADDDGKRLSGGHKYTLKFPKGKLPSRDAFWSVTLFDPESSAQAGSFSRIALGAHDHLQPGPDGSLTLYIQHESPGPEKDVNWLPAPEGTFLLGLRLYWPHEVADSTWYPPPVLRVKQ
jgi:hypothetical protein